MGRGNKSKGTNRVSARKNGTRKGQGSCVQIRARAPSMNTSRGNREGKDNAIGERTWVYHKGEVAKARVKGYWGCLLRFSCRGGVHYFHQANGRVRGLSPSSSRLLFSLFRLFGNPHCPPDPAPFAPLHAVSGFPEHAEGDSVRHELTKVRDSSFSFGWKRGLRWNSGSVAMWVCLVRLVCVVACLQSEMILLPPPPAAFRFFIIRVFQRAGRSFHRGWTGNTTPTHCPHPQRIPTPTPPPPHRTPPHPTLSTAFPTPVRTLSSSPPYILYRVPLRKRKRSSGGSGGGRGDGGRRGHRHRGVRRSHFDSSSESSDGGGAGFADHDRGFDRYQRKVRGYVFGRKYELTDAICFCSGVLFCAGRGNYPVLTGFTPVRSCVRFCAL